MPRDRIVFWQQSPSPHQAPLARALVAMSPAADIVCVFQSAPSPERLAMGWGDAGYGAAQVVMAPDERRVAALLNQEPHRSVHVFSSFVHVPRIAAALRRCLAVPNVLVGVLSEARDWRGLKGLGRQMHSLFAERRYRSRVDFVLAIGGQSVQWFKKCGYSADKVFLFAYAVDGPDENRVDADGNIRLAIKGSSSGFVQIAFVGQLVEGKQPELLIHSLRRLRDEPWRLWLAGSGDRRDASLRLAKRFDLHDRMTFLGHCHNTAVRQALEASDLLVLPSRWDGWGAVINEALMSGVPVICSDWCGARVLIRPGWNGDVFRCDSVEDLTRKLHDWIRRGKLTEDHRQTIRDWSQSISASAVARYFLDVVRSAEDPGSPRPQPPWMPMPMHEAS